MEYSNAALTRRKALLGALATGAGLSIAEADDNLPKNPQSPTPASKLVPTEQMLHTTVQIICETNKPPPYNISAGTGFLFGFFHHNNHMIPALVTNKHVIADSKIGHMRITNSSSDGQLPNIGSVTQVDIPDFESRWIPHPDNNVDIAILPLGDIINKLQNEGHKPFVIALDQSLIPTNEQLKELTPVEDVLVVGYPDGISDIHNNVPLIRKGITASPVYLDFNNQKEFIIDAAIFHGSSGSPVFLFNQGTWAARNGSSIVGGVRVQFLGIVRAVFEETVDGEMRVIPAPTQRVVASTRVPNSLGICLKASRILEFEPLLVQRGVQPPDGYKMRVEAGP